MEYRVEEIARAAGVSVDTVRFYQSRGLLPAPEKRGRKAIYSDAHLERLQRIRQLNREGLTLAAVHRVLDQENTGHGVRESLLGALAEAEGERRYTRAELAQAAAIPEFLIDGAERAGLLGPLESAGESTYTQSDLDSLRAATSLLQQGFPLQELMPLAIDHAAHTNAIADRSIELFDRYVRESRENDEAPSKEAVIKAFRELLPAVTTLVALHFQRTLLSRARTRLASSGDEQALADALEATEEGRLRVSWDS